ncbi:MAG: response regulator [Nitrospinota bacterium]|nr:response regulator [Nitrospinota bacterium]
MTEYFDSKILIVDDEPPNILLLEKLLKKEGYCNIRALDHSPKFLEVFQEFEPDLVLLDINMPEVDGFEILFQLREIQVDSFLPVLVLTAQMDMETRLKALDCGAHDFLNKPFDLGEVSFRIRNLLETRRLHNLIKDQNRSLEQKVRERTAELEASHAYLLHSEKLSAVGKLAASISHEFNNPILGIRNILEQVSSSVSLDSELEELVQLAIRESSRVMDLATKLKQFYRPSTDQLISLDLHSILDDMIVLKKKDFIEKKIELVKRYAPDLPNVQVVEDQLKQVILNLLQNAEESITGERGRIEISTNHIDSQVEVQIRDTGCGISAQHVKNIFEPFFTTKSAVKGTGLGLFVSYGIIKRHGGDISCTSQPGEGTLFTLTLPLPLPLSGRENS